MEEDQFLTAPSYLVYKTTLAAIVVIIIKYQGKNAYDYVAGNSVVMKIKLTDP